MLMPLMQPRTVTTNLIQIRGELNLSVPHTNELCPTFSFQLSKVYLSLLVSLQNPIELTPGFLDAQDDYLFGSVFSVEV